MSEAASCPEVVQHTTLRLAYAVLPTVTQCLLSLSQLAHHSSVVIINFSNVQRLQIYSFPGLHSPHPPPPPPLLFLLLLKLLPLNTSKQSDHYHCCCRCSLLLILLTLSAPLQLLLLKLFRLATSPRAGNIAIGVV